MVQRQLGSHLEEKYLCIHNIGLVWWALWFMLLASWYASSIQGQPQNVIVPFIKKLINDYFNWQVALLTTCMTTPDDSSCTINAVSDSLPLMVCSFLRSLHNSFQALWPCTTLSRWRTWTAAWRRSRTVTAQAAMERQATTSATQDPVWLDGFNNWVCFNSNGYFDLLPYLLREAVKNYLADFVR